MSIRYKNMLKNLEVVPQFYQVFFSAFLFHHDMSSPSYFWKSSNTRYEANQKNGDIGKFDVELIFLFLTGISPGFWVQIHKINIQLDNDSNEKSYSKGCSNPKMLVKAFLPNVKTEFRDLFKYFEFFFSLFCIFLFIPAIRGEFKWYTF